MRRPFFVAITGGSGSGKSWLAKQLSRKFGRKGLLVSLDDFYRDRSHLRPDQRGKRNFDHPLAIDWPLLRKALKDLRQGDPTRLPGYDFSTHCRRPGFREAEPPPLVLVEGLWLLHSPALRAFFDLSIFLDCPRTTRLARRLERDLRTRGRTRKSVLEQFRTTVQPMHKRFVDPQKRWATIVVKAPFSAQKIAEIRDQIRERMAGFSSVVAAKRGNTC